MGNSVGYYAVARDLGSSKVISPTLSDLNLLTEQGDKCGNVQRLSVTCLDDEGEVLGSHYLDPNKPIEITAPAPLPPAIFASYGSELSVQSCPEVGREGGRTFGQKQISYDGNTMTLVVESFRLQNHDVWRDIDSDTSSQPYIDTVQEIYEADVTKEKDGSRVQYLETCLDEPNCDDSSCNKKTTTETSRTTVKKPDHYISAHSTKVIESLLLELQEGAELSLLPSVSGMGGTLNDISTPSDRPVVYTATNAADWKLGTILEESGSHQKSPTGNTPLKSEINLEKYNTSDEEGEECIAIGSVVNVNDINAEREKEEGIQMCLEQFEEKIERIEECLQNSGESHVSNSDKAKPETKSHSKRESSVDVSAVIEGNHNITYLHFGTCLEDDVSEVVAHEYTKKVGVNNIFGKEDLKTKGGETHSLADGVCSPLTNESSPKLGEPMLLSREKGQQGEPSHIKDICEEKIADDNEDHGMSNDNDEDPERYQEAMEITEVTESWQQLYVGPEKSDSNGQNCLLNTANTDRSESSSNCLAEEMSQLQLENEKLTARNRSLQREVEELRRVKESMVEEDLQLKPRINQMTMELTHAKEALSALKADRKRLKAEKFDLLNQMKQLYATLEDKEKELRDFIRNYEQRMKESDESLRHLASERDETEREKWNILKHARDESEKVVKLSAQLGLKETAFRKLQDELEHVRKQLNSVGYYSDAESVRTNGLPTPTASTPACSPLPVSTPTPTPNGRGSSADSGVRLSSDRDSTASHDGGVGTPKESPSLSPLYATPVSLRGEIQGGDDTPTSAPTPTAAMSGLANSNANSGGLSRSAEQLCERLAEAAESSKGRGSSTLLRKSQKSGGTWGSISRVFARQKKRAALDASLYEGNGSDKRASWSPSSSLCASPLTEESYSEKLRLLEEAQHIPLERWKALTVLAWLEVTLGMPQYGAMCAENVRSGKVLLELNDSELETGLGIAHPMHRKKLRLAIEELREPRLTRFPRISILGHTWVSSEWLPDLGLPQYSEAFANNLVDGRLLEALTKKELEKHLGVHRKFHQASIIHGVHLLRIVRFDRQTLAERRRQCEHMDTDPVVWTNHRWVRWARSIDLAEYADNLKDSGVHGALVTLESSFTSDTMATALGIPQSKNIIRRHLATELESLVTPARKQLEEQARYAKIERRRQEKLAAGGSLGRSFSRSYGTGLEKGDKDKRRASLRGSLSRALGLRLREEAATIANNGGESSSSGGQSPAVSSRINSHHAHHARPRSSVMPSAAYVHHETHRRVKSIGDIETITVTPV